MKIRYKLFLLSLLTPLLCIGVSFGAYDIYGGLTTIYSNSYSWSSASSSNTIVSNFSPNKTYCGYIYGGSSNYAITSVKVKCQSNNSTYIVSNGNVGKGKYFCFTNYMCTSNGNLVIETSGAPMASSYNVSIYSVDLPITVEANDCSSVEFDLSSCLSSLSGANSSLSSCQSDLSSCTNSCDTLVSQCQEDKSNLQSSYSGCLESNASLNNYNYSLLDQLEACYISGSTTTGDLTIYEYQLSRSDGLTDLYLPITNSIKLPYGYRGFLDNGVLAIKDLDSLDYAYNIDNSDFQENVVGSYSVVYLFLMSSGLFLIFLYVIRRYFIGFKSTK